MQDVDVQALWLQLNRASTVKAALIESRHELGEEAKRSWRVTTGFGYTVGGPADRIFRDYLGSLCGPRESLPAPVTDSLVLWLLGHHGGAPWPDMLDTGDFWRRSSARAPRSQPGRGQRSCQGAA